MGVRDFFNRLVGLSIRQARRIVIALLGSTVLLIGLIMVFTPGPAMVVIPSGLAILAIEFVWARRLLRRIKVNAQKGLARFGKKSRSSKDGGTELGRHPDSENERSGGSE